MAVIGPSRGTFPERAVRMWLARNGLRFKMHADLPGRPDFLVKSTSALGRKQPQPEKMIAVFVDGVFWHHPSKSKMLGMGWYWRTKLKGNVARDRRNRGALRRMGYKTMTIWDDDIRSGCRRLLKLTGEGT